MAVWAVEHAYQLVALRKESVDRNLILPLSGSLCCVALRKESVDRNVHRRGFEICCQGVALRKESVDRNAKIMSASSGSKRRSPQGERG